MKQKMYLLLMGLCFTGGCVLIPSFNNYGVEVSIGKGCNARYFTVEYAGFSGQVATQENDKEYTMFEKAAVYVGEEIEIPQTALCTWISEDGTKYAVVFPIKSQLPRCFRSSQDTLVFTLTPSNSVDFAVDIWYEKYRQRRVPIGTSQGRLKE